MSGNHTSRAQDRLGESVVDAITALTDEIDRLQGELNDVTAQNETLQSELDEARVDIARLESDAAS